MEFQKRYLKVGQANSIQIQRTDNLKNMQIHRLQGNVDYFQVNYYKLLSFQVLTAFAKPKLVF